MILRMISNYKAELGLDSSYMRAKQVWDVRLGTAHAQASHWRWIAFGLLAIVAILCAGLVYVGSQSKIVPYGVEIGGNGQINGINKAIEKTRHSINNRLYTIFEGRKQIDDQLLDELERVRFRVNSQQ